MSSLSVISSASATDVGLVRDANEDSLLLANNIGLYGVADGMGGHAGGKQASSMAMTVIEEVLRSGDLPKTLANAESMKTAPTPMMLQDAIMAASRRIFDAGQAEPKLRGMGTTVTIIAINGTRAFIGHVGDSRCYLLRDDSLRLLTTDHSLVNDQVRAGLMTPAQAQVSDLRNIITRSVGCARQVEVDTVGVDVATGDRFLLCSDGLTNTVDDDAIAASLRSPSLDDAAGALIESALESGGLDNVTVVCLDVGTTSD